MSNFLTTEQWQEFCNLSNDSFRDFNFSGTPWTKLDTAVRNYISNQGDQQRVALKKAFDKFIQDKGGILENAEGKKDIKTKRNHFGIILALNTYINEIASSSTPPATSQGANTVDVLSPYLLKAKIKYKKGKGKEWKNSIKKAWKDIYDDLKGRAADIYASIGQAGKDFAAAAAEGQAALLPESVKAGFKSFEIACDGAARSASRAATTASNAASRFKTAMSFWRSKEPKTSTQNEPQEQKGSDSGSGMDTNQLVEAVKGLIQFQISQVVAELITQYSSSLPAATLTNQIFGEFWDQMKEEITSDLESIIPYYGLAKEGAKAFKHIKQTAKRVGKLIEYGTAVKFLNPSNKDVVACLDSVDLLLKQIAAETAAKAAVASANFAFGVAAAVGTAGIDVASSITGTVTVGIKFLYLVSGFVGTYFAMEEANRLLNLGNLGSVQKAMDIFPLLGAFVIVKLYPNDSVFDDQDRSKDVFILFDIVEQLKPPFDEPLIQLYRFKTKSIIDSAKEIVAKSHFEVTDVPPTPVPIPDEPNAVDPRQYFNKWYILTLARKLSRKKRLLKINLMKSLFFNMALIVTENFRLYEHVNKALKKYRGEIGGGSGFLGYRILGGGGNKNILGVSWQSQESEKAVALLDAIIKIDNISSKQIVEIVIYQERLFGYDLLFAAYIAEAEQFVDYKQTSTFERFKECKEKSFALLRIVQYLLGFPLEDEYQLNVNDETLRSLNKGELPVRLNIKSRFQSMLLEEYQQWVRNVIKTRQLYNRSDFPVVKRTLPT
jgi:hypothetical protein